MAYKICFMQCIMSFKQSLIFWCPRVQKIIWQLCKFLMLSHFNDDRKQRDTIFCCNYKSNLLCNIQVCNLIKQIEKQYKQNELGIHYPNNVLRIRQGIMLGQNATHVQFHICTSYLKVHMLNTHNTNVYHNTWESCMVHVFVCLCTWYQQVYAIVLYQKKMKKVVWHKVFSQIEKVCIKITTPDTRPLYVVISQGYCITGWQEMEWHKSTMTMTFFKIY